MQRSAFQILGELSLGHRCQVFSLSSRPRSGQSCLSTAGVLLDAASAPTSTHEPADLANFLQLVRRHAPVCQLSQLSPRISRQLQEQLYKASEVQELICAVSGFLGTSSCDGAAEQEFVKLLMESCTRLLSMQAQPELIRSARAIAHLAKRHRFRSLLVQTRLLDGVQVELLEPDQISKFSWCLARADERSFAGLAPLLGQVVLAAVEQFNQLSAFSVSNLAWTLAKTGGRKLASHNAEVRRGCWVFFEKISAEAKLNDFDASDLCGLSWAFATALVKPLSNFSEELFLHAAVQLDELKSAHFVNLCWAAAGMIATGSLLISRLGQASQQRLGSFQARDLSVLAWAFARLLHFQVLPSILTAAVEVLDEFSPQNLCNLLWALAKAQSKLKVCAQSLAASQQLDAVVTVAWRGLHTFQARDLSSFAWALACLTSSRLQVSHAANEATRKIEAFTPRDLASFAWALASLKEMKHPFLDLAARKSQNVVNEFTGQDVANLAWAFAHAYSERLLAGSPAATIQGTFPSLATRATAASDLSAQGLSNLAWACATVATADKDGSLCGKLVSRAAALQGQLQLRDISSLAWAFVMLGCEDVHLQFLMSQACELLLACCRLHLLGDVGRDKSVQDAASILTLLWTASFARTPGSEVFDQQLIDLGRKCLQTIGRRFDDEVAASRLQAMLPLLPSKTTGSALRASGELIARSVEPLIVHESLDVVTLYKPHGWEVDQGSSTGDKRLSTYLRSQAPLRHYSILRDREHLHGFLHRLDVPSSGLILQAKTYRAFYHLMAQLHLGEMVRDYVVLCHGWVEPSTRQIVARVLWSDSAGSSSPSKALSSNLTGGKPSITKLKVLAHLVREQKPHSLLAIRIQTGRRHQIRAHLAHVGHPVVCDPKYSDAMGQVSPPLACSNIQDESLSLQTSIQRKVGGKTDDLTSADAAWCPRNFLHRYRLEYSDALGAHEVQAPLPQDLKQVLPLLSIRADQRESQWHMSTEQLRGWHAGNAMQDWARLPTLDSPREAEIVSVLCSNRHCAQIETHSLGF